MTDAQKAVLVCVAYFLLVLTVSHFHKIGAYETETDFYGAYAKEAQKIWHGEKYEYTMHGPGYPLILGLVNFIFHDWLLSGKIISVTSSALLLFFIFKLFESLFNSKLALLTLPILMVNNTFIRSSVTATTDMFFYALSILAIYLVFRQPISYWSFILAGVISGFAYVTRTNGFYIPLALIISTFLISFLRVSFKERTKLVVSMLLAFFITALPWLITNYQRHGNPFYTDSYLDVAANYFGTRSHSSEGIIDIANKFHSMKDVIMFDPLHFVGHFIRNTVVYGFKTLLRLFSLPMNAFLVLGLLILGFRVIKSRSLNPRHLAFSVFIALPFLIQSLNVWEDRYFLFLIPIYSSVIVYLLWFLYSISGKVHNITLQRRVRYGVAAIFLLGLCAATFETITLTRGFIASEPVYLIKASQFLHGVTQPNEGIIARKPHLSFMAGLKFIYFPEVQTPDELLEYARALNAHYVLYGRVERSMRSQLSGLYNPSEAPLWLKPIYQDRDAGLVVYSINLSP